MVAMSMADGWARVTGRPQAVIVHVDVGTQALGCALAQCQLWPGPCVDIRRPVPIHRGR